MARKERQRKALERKEMTKQQKVARKERLRVLGKEVVLTVTNPPSRSAVRVWIAQRDQDLMMLRSGYFKFPESIPFI